MFNVLVPNQSFIFWKLNFEARIGIKLSSRSLNLWAGFLLKFIFGQICTCKKRGGNSGYCDQVNSYFAMVVHFSNSESIIQFNQVGVYFFSNSICFE